MNTFNKEERLCSRKLIDLLFKNGSSFLLYPFRISYLLTDTTGKFPAQVVINVSKKRYKHAVDRNLIKRRSREAYRIQKQALLYPVLPDQKKLLLLSIQFVGKKIYDHSFFEKKIAGVFKKLTSILETKEVSTSIDVSKSDETSGTTNVPQLREAKHNTGSDAAN